MPLTFPRGAAAWDPAHHVIRFTATDADSGAVVECSITARAMLARFGATPTSPADLLDAFGRFRVTIEFAASARYDRAGRGESVRLLTRDLDAATRSAAGAPPPAPRRPPATP
jgi:hypothetical protein